MSIFKSVDVSRALKYALAAGILFSIPAFFYIRIATYRSSWLLYVGSFCFFLVIILYTLLLDKQKNKQLSTVTMIFGSHFTTLAGVVISCILCFAMLSLLIPGYLHNGPAAVVAPDAPAQSVIDKTNGISFRSFVGAIILNFSFGSFASIIFPFTAKLNQKGGYAKPSPLKNNAPE